MTQFTIRVTPTTTARPGVNRGGYYSISQRLTSKYQIEIEMRKDPLSCEVLRWELILSFWTRSKFKGLYQPVTWQFYFFYKGFKSRLVCWDVGCYVRKPCLSSHFTTIRYSYRPGRKVIITRGGSTSSQSNFMTL